MERNAKLTKLARELRKNQTKEESLLWYNFLRKYPVRFHRQYVIGNYIVDFYCHAARLIVELDGSGHYEPEQMAADRSRTVYLEKQGLEVLRFTNLDVIREFAAVCEEIDKKVRNRKL